MDQNINNPAPFGQVPPEGLTPANGNVVPPLAEPPKQKKMSLKILVIVLAAVVVVGGGAAGAIYFMGQNDDKDNNQNNNSSNSSNNSSSTDIPTFESTTIYDTANLTVTVDKIEKDSYGNYVARGTIKNNASFRIPGIMFDSIIIDGFQYNDEGSSHLEKYEESGQPSTVTDDIQPGVTEPFYFYISVGSTDSERLLKDRGFFQAQTIRFHMGYFRNEGLMAMTDPIVTKEIKTSNFKDGKANHISDDFVVVYESSEYDIYAKAYTRDVGIWGNYQQVELFFDNKSTQDIPFGITDLIVDGDSAAATGSGWGTITSLPSFKTHYLTSGLVGKEHVGKKFNFDIKVSGVVVANVDVTTDVFIPKTE